MVVAVVVKVVGSLRIVVGTVAAAAVVAAVAMVMQA